MNGKLASCDTPHCFTHFFRNNTQSPTVHNPTYSSAPLNIKNQWSKIKFKKFQKKKKKEISERSLT